MGGSKFGYYAHLVWGRDRAYLADYEKMFRRDHWQDILADIDSNTPVALKNNLEQAIAIASLNALGSFHMRILYPLLTYPFPILMLAKKSHDEVCPERQQTAARILATPIDHLEASTMKFRIMHFNELQDCARTGLLTKPLHAKAQVLAEQLPAESMTIEGLNIVLRAIFAERHTHQSNSLILAWP